MQRVQRVQRVRQVRVRQVRVRRVRVRVRHVRRVRAGRMRRGRVCRVRRACLSEAPHVPLEWRAVLVRRRASRRLLTRPLVLFPRPAPGVVSGKKTRQTVQ